MIVSYRVSSPTGDIPVGPHELSRAFKIDPERAHPFLTLGDYFQAIETFVCSLSLCSNFQDPEGNGPAFSGKLPIERLTIRSEKHGAFYHIASIELRGKSHSSKFAVITALSKRNRKRLHREFNILQNLGRRYRYPYLPRVYAIKELPVLRAGGRSSWALVLAEWLENYHEWHFVPGHGLGRAKIRLWDFGKGFRWLTSEEGLELFKQAAKILTLYVDGLDFSQIHPWHHGAGDFVVRAEGGECTVRLTTARNYKPILFLPAGQRESPYLSFLYFLLNMTIRMRLDRVEGIGKTIWIEPWVLLPVLNGFFDAIQGMIEDKRKLLFEPSDFRILLRSFTKEDFVKLLEPLLGLYEKEKDHELPIIRENLVSHGADLYRVCQTLLS